LNGIAGERHLRSPAPFPQECRLGISRTLGHESVRHSAQARGHAGHPWRKIALFLMFFFRYWKEF
jgi:hypothetical protein